MVLREIVRIRAHCGSASNDDFALVGTVNGLYTEFDSTNIQLLFVCHRLRQCVPKGRTKKRMGTSWKHIHCERCLFWNSENCSRFFTRDDCVSKEFVKIAM